MTDRILKFEANGIKNIINLNKTGAPDRPYVAGIKHLLKKGYHSAFILFCILIDSTLSPDYAAYLIYKV